MTLVDGNRKVVENGPPAMRALVCLGFGWWLQLVPLGWLAAAASAPPTACAGGIGPSRVVEASPDGGLRQQCPGSEARYLQADAMTGALIEICGGGSEARALPTSGCGETRIGGMALWRGVLYYTTGTSVRGVNVESGVDAEVAGALGSIAVEGAHLGSTDDDLLEVRVRGVTCQRRERFSASEVLCWTTSPIAAGPNAELEVEPTQIEVETAAGGNGTASSRLLAELRAAEYGVAAPPAVFGTTRLENYALRAVALCVVRDQLWASSLGTMADPVTGTPGGFGGIVALDPVTGAPWVVVRDAPRVLGIAYDGDRVYYSDASRGVVASRPPRAGKAGDEWDVVLTRLLEPRGLALDPAIPSDIYVAAGSRVARLDATRSTSTPQDVVLGPRTAAPTALFLLPPDPAAAVDRAKRLVWLDANRPAPSAATKYGTRRIDLGGQPPLRFPTALAWDNETSTLYIAEWLGRIWSETSDHTHRILLREDSSTAAAPAIRDVLDAEDLARARLQPALRTYHRP